MVSQAHLWQMTNNLPWCPSRQQENILSPAYVIAYSAGLLLPFLQNFLRDTVCILLNDSKMGRETNKFN